MVSGRNPAYFFLLNSAINILPTNLMINVEYNTQAISYIAEYFRYTVLGHICLVEIGGIVLTGVDTTICSTLPVAITRPCNFISYNLDSSISCIVYGSIGGKFLNIQFDEKLSGKTLYGYVLYLI